MSGLLSPSEAMDLAINEAIEALTTDDVPVGAVLLSEAGEVLGLGRNRREERGDPTAHAEIEALRDASQRGGWRREGTTLFVTLEPCAMCMGALLQARVRCLVYGATDAKAGAAKSLYRMAEDPRLNHRMDVVGGLEEERCSQLLKDFFSNLRARKRNETER
jgi:tRNA(adenine34) deaminase